MSSLIVFLVLGVTFTVSVQGQATSLPALDIHTQMAKLQADMHRLDLEVQEKNDIQQMLVKQVRHLEENLAIEQQRTNNLTKRVEELESRHSSQSALITKLEANQSTTNILVTSLQAELQSVHRELNTTILNLAHMDASWNNKLTNLHQEISHLASEVNDTVLIQIKNLETAIMSKPAKNQTFFAYRNLTNMVANKPLIFTGKISESGSQYDSSSGVFTAPVSGVYWFSATIGADAQDYLKCYIMRNDADYLVEVYSSQFTKRSSTTSSVAVDLQAGDRVYVGKCSGNAQIDSYKSSFSGFLIDAF